MTKVYIGLGSNIGDRKSNLLNAIKMLSRHTKINLICSSSIYETAPWGYKNQRKFLNAVCKIETDLSPEKLLSVLESIEKKLGRKKCSIRYGPRVIDLDILFYGRRKINKKNLIIPHPEIYNRDFVLKPLYEIGPEMLNQLPATASRSHWR